MSVKKEASEYIEKMADGVVNDPNQLPKISNEIPNSEDTVCYDCTQLKLELVSVL
jgi:hypothetical protein